MMTRSHSIMSCCFAVLLCCVLGCGESVPPPAKAESFTAIQSLVDGTVERVLKAPKTANPELSMLIEGLEGYARQFPQQVQPVVDLAKEVQGKTGAKPDVETLRTDMNRLKEAAHGLSAA